MFNKDDRELLEKMSKRLSNMEGRVSSVEDKLFNKIVTEKDIEELESKLKHLKEEKAKFEFTEQMYQGKVIIMRMPLQEGTPMLYLADYCDGRCLWNYRWSSKRENACTLTFERAYNIKNEFAAFKDTRENLLIVCVDDLKDEDNIEYKHPLINEKIVEGE